MSGLTPTTSLYESPASYRNTCLRLTSENLVFVFGQLQKDSASPQQDAFILEPVQKDPASSQDDQESEAYSAAFPSYPLATRMGWIVCSQVCRRWREVALATPSLWRHISVSLGPRWLECSLARSQGLPVPGIHLFGNMTSAYHAVLNRAPPVCLFDVASISSLSLKALNPDDFYFLFKDIFSRSKAPILEAVELTVPSPEGVRRYRNLSLGEIIDNSPSLRRISFLEVAPRWTPLPTSSCNLTFSRLSFTETTH
ncbi:hypothetical protein BC834DRAFT_374007 [Gloeopeniophorella convolvens]|nr:hypothetical protein BC834DRAFT_374007 [Gloeopeniophorella convolvens]